MSTSLVRHQGVNRSGGKETIDRVVLLGKVGRGILVGSRDQSRDEGEQELLQFSGSGSKPEPHVRSNLIVPGAARVQFPTHCRTDQFLRERERERERHG